MKLLYDIAEEIQLLHFIFLSLSRVVLDFKQGISKVINFIVLEILAVPSSSILPLITFFFFPFPLAPFILFFFALPTLLISFFLLLHIKPLSQHDLLQFNSYMSLNLIVF